MRQLQDEKVYAWYIKLDAASYTGYETCITVIFNACITGANAFPMRIQMRLVPDIGNIANRNNLQRAIRLRIRQQKFVQRLHFSLTWEVAQLGFHDPNLNNQTLQDLVMQIPAPDTEKLNTTLFNAMVPTPRDN